MFCKLTKAQFRYRNFLIHNSWFLKKVSQGPHFFVVHMWHLKSLQKGGSPEFLILPALKLALCGLVVFTNTNTYIVTEGTHFKTFLKENYLFVLPGCKMHIY